MVTANTNEINGLDGIELYAEAKNQHDVDDSGQLCCGKENENPSYEPAKSPDAAVVNPIYERLVLSRSERLVIIHHLGEGGFLEDHMILRGKVGDQSSPTEQKGEGL